MLEDDSAFQRADIFLDPPSEGEFTDEDSGDEDNGGAIDNLSGRLLSSRASVTVIHKERQRIDAVADSQSSDSENSSDSGEPQPKQPRPPVRKTTKKKKTVRTWLKQDIPTSEKFDWHHEAPRTENLPQTPTGLFELFFDDDVLDMLVEQSVQYAGSKGNHEFTTSRDEIRAFLGILLVSGYSTVPRRRMYWSLDDDLRNAAIAETMSRNRFDEIMRFIHIVDNNKLDSTDKMAKIRPLLTAINEKCLIYFTKEQNLSIDESMIPYYGRHGAKQFIRGKPIRFGFKIWALTTPLGYVVQFEPYQGKKGQQAGDTTSFGMGGGVVLDLLSELQKDRPYHLTFDNLFTSMELVDELTRLGIACTGTIRANRVGDCPLTSVKDLQKSPRGTYDYSYDNSNNLIIVRWNDNSIVNVASNVHGVGPLQKAGRWSRAESQRVRIDQPFLISHYNKTMGGVDRMDQNVDKYRIGIRSKKWWWCIFAYCIDVCVQQVWHLYRATPAGKDQPMDLLDVRREIAAVYLAKGKRAIAPGRPKAIRAAPRSKNIRDDIRTDRVEHYICTRETQRRCMLCGMKTKRGCVKCGANLHERCFQVFHQ